MSGCRLRCPSCGYDRNKTGESSFLDGIAYRKRKCQSCGVFFSTVEVHMPEDMRHVYRMTSDSVKRQRAADVTKVHDLLRNMGQPAQVATVPEGRRSRRR